ncbi:IclR family transcriptional regulator [Cypionkella sp.]|uniref:IclR family transcriptional regulator n=1 Tax=Cypionkella sp. TaxID=2811411 RepID=UPI002ABB1CFA|nr:IclR family transcriptional regulator [Cypionkella sp.]MDZ4393457.1 IclR family transcriptional regulator [Cypionkella sp.]
MAHEPSERPDTVRAADTCLRILERVAFADRSLGVTEIAAEVSIAKGAVHKHLRTLIDHGLVVQDPVTTHYSLGPKMWLMGQKAPASQQLAETALPLMRATRDDLGLAVVLSVATPRAAFVVATLSSNQPIEIGVRPGGELSLHSSAQGKVFLALGPPDLFRSLPKPLMQITPKTVVDVDKLAEEFTLIRQRGYATAPEQSLLGINAVAAPIFNPEGKVVASIGLIGSIQNLDAEPSETQLAALFALTREISRRLG